MPPLDDELAMMVGDYDTLDDLRAGVREELERTAEQTAESEYLDKALDAFIAAAVKIEYPPQAIEREAELALNRMQSSLASSGIELDTYLGMIGKSRETYKQELRPAAEERLKKRLVIGEISRLEDLEVEPEEIEDEIERMGASLGPEGEEFLETLRSPGGRMMVADDLLTAKAQELALGIAKGEAPEPEGEAEEPEEADDESEPEADEADDQPEADEAGARDEPEADEAEPEPEAEDESEPEANEVEAVAAESVEED
jgi:trigger factor